MDLSIIIVNWNSAHYVMKCLPTIYSETKGLELEIIVVDNASYDDCEQIIKNEFPDVIFVQSNENVGFAKANNLGFKYSSGKTLLFLNPDTEVIGSAFNQMFSFLQSTPDAGAAGCKLLNSDLSLQTSCVQPYPTILNQVLNIEYLKRQCPKLKLWGIMPLFGKNNTPTKVGAVSGACLMIKKKIFEQIGTFSTDYFMYSEDIDLCYKVWKNGWNIYYVPTVKVIHHGGTSSSQNSVSSFSSVMIHESRWRFFRKTKSEIYSQAYRLAMLSSSFIRIGMLLFSWPIMKIYGKNSSIEVALKKWRAILRWTLGLEKWVTHY
jgi:hypothetical protein